MCVSESVCVCSLKYFEGVAVEGEIPRKADCEYVEITFWCDFVLARERERVRVLVC